MPLTNINKAIVAIGAAPFKASFDILSADLMLLADLPEVTGLPANRLPANHHYIGALYADLPLELPPEAKAVLSRPGLKVYCAMGSSGSAEALRAAIGALKATRYNVVAATTSIVDPGEFAPFNERFFAARYLPASSANALADVAVTHGGQGTLQNRMAAGVPIVGTPFQFEQQSNLDMLVRAGAGIKIKLRDFDGPNLLRAIETIAADPSYRQRAIRLQKLYQTADGAQTAADLMFDFIRKRKLAATA